MFGVIYLVTFDRGSKVTAFCTISSFSRKHNYILPTNLAIASSIMNGFLYILLQVAAFFIVISAYKSVLQNKPIKK